MRLLFFIYLFFALQILNAQDSRDFYGSNTYFEIDTLNISINQLEQKLISSHKRKKLPKILVVVHFAGASCEMDRIKKLSNKYKFRIIEDASHAIGGDFNNYKVGSCKYSDITVFSFHPVKIITSGEGGIALTNNKDLAKSMSYLRSHGIIRDKKVLNNSEQFTPCK